MAEDGEPVIACSLTGGDQAERVEQWQILLSAAELSREPLVMAVTVASGYAASVAELAREEQECCPFLGFRLDFLGSKVTLTISAPNETAATFLDAFTPGSAIC
jgi:MerR family copper efflux transcriptional regulator